MTDMDMTADRAFQIAWIVYINGIEVPVSSVSISYGVWQIPEAEITMIPDPILQRLGAEDRVSVQVFYCDYWHDASTPQFRLMFDGEIVGWNYVNVKEGRAISFSCVDYIQIFTQLFFFFMSSIDDIAVGVSGQDIGVTANGVQLAGFGAIYPYSLFAQGLTGQGSPIGEEEQEGGVATGTDLITRPIDFVYNVVRAMIQVDAPNRSVPAANFFAPWSKRTNFHRRFMALPFLEDSESPGIFPILRAVRADFAVSAVASLSSSIGSAGSIWQMLEDILKTMMMEIAMIPTAPAVLGEYNSLKVLGAPGPNTVSDGLSPVFLCNYFVKPQFMFGIPPTCNVFFPSQIQQFGYEENYITQPTRMYFNEESWTSYLGVAQNVGPGLNTLLRDALAVAHPEEVNIAARAAIENPGENGKNILVYPEEFFKGPVVDRRPMPRWFAFLAGSQQGSVTLPPADAPPAVEDETTDAEDRDLARDVAPGDTERNVFRLYAKYEYFKERYARRTGGLNLLFNPYPVPGFPCAIFDRRSTQIDVMGYVLSVRQNLTTRSWSTQVSFSHGRTMQEMFALMNRQFTMENEINRLNAGEVNNAIQEGTQTQERAEHAEAVGAIATAPPEPLREIRDIIQNFSRAEAFYRSLFFRMPAPDADQISEQQLRAVADRRARSEETSNTPDQPVLPETPLPNVVDNLTQLQRDLPEGKRAAFIYNELIDFVDETGARQSLRLEGLDATARQRLLEIFGKMRQGTASDEELQFVNRSTGWTAVTQQVEGQPTDPNVSAILNTLELAVHTATVESNITGDQNIAPKPEAEHLFNSYEAAMQYGSRPVCTLDEYISFLGTVGIKEGRIDPGVALLNGDSRTFPAHYYMRIRRYVPGPPENIPITDITNTSSVTTPDGVGTTTPQNAEGSEDNSPRVQGLPEGFPENRANWDSVLLQYRIRALTSLPPRT